MANEKYRLNTAILSAFCEAGNQMRFDVAQPLLRALAAASPKHSAAHLEIIISIYQHLSDLMNECDLSDAQGRRAAA